MKTLESSRRLRCPSTGWRWAAIAAWCVTVSLGAQALAATLHPGDIVVAGQQAVFRVDPVTGDYAVISDATHGSGPLMYAGATVTLASDGQLWVTDLGESRIDVPPQPAQILKIDPITGNRVAIPIQGLAGNVGVMTREVNGQLIVGGIGALFRLNPSTGAATEVSGPHAGSGPAFNFLQGFAIAANSAFVSNFQSTFRVDLTTGARTIISGSGIGTGPAIWPGDVAFDAAGFLIETVTTTSQSSPGVFRVDPATGNRVAISSPTVGDGEPLGVLGGLGIGADGSIYTAARANGIVGVLKIDPATGNRQWLANLTGAATSLGGVTIVPANVPEPSTIALAALGGILLLLRPQRLARITRRQTLFSVVVLCLTVGNPNAAPAATLHPGDIIVAGKHGDFDGALYRIDPATGEPTLIADNTHGAGPIMRNIAGISIASDGQLWVADYGTRGLIDDVPNYAAQILKVDPATGNRVAVPGQTPNLSVLARERDNRLVVSAQEAFYSIDPISGAKTLLSGLGVGSGPSLNLGLFDLAGNYAFTINFPNITKVDLTTGKRTNIPEPNVGPGASFLPQDIAVDSAGFLIETAVWVTGSTAQTAVFRINPSTGDFVTISSPSVGGGAPLPGGLHEEHLQILGGLRGVAVGHDGSIFASAIGVGLSGVFKIDPVTGDRQLLSNFHDVMPTVYGVAIVPQPVPEPATISLAALAVGLLLFPRSRLRLARVRRQSAFMTVVIAIALSVVGESQAATLRPGDLVVGARGPDLAGVVLRVDPITGAQTIISDNAHGAGPLMRNGVSVTIAPDGSLLTIDYGVQPDGKLWPGNSPPYYPPQLLRIDPETGNRTQIPIQAGLIGGSAYARQEGTRVITNDFAALWSTDLSTGASTLLSGRGVGSGTAFQDVFSFVLNRNSVLVTDFNLGVFRVDLATGGRTLISGEHVGTGPIDSPFDIAVDSHGQLIATSSMSGILRGDPTTGNRSVLSSDTIGTGPTIIDGSLTRLALAADDTIYAPINRHLFTGSPQWFGILKIDPVTGDRQVLADLTAVTAGVGSVAVVPQPVPEPATISLAALAVGLLLFPRSRLRLARVRRQSAFMTVVIAIALSVVDESQAATLRPGDIVVAGHDGAYNGMLFLVDPVTGAHTIISDNSHGTGPVMHVAAAVTMASDGQLWVVDIGKQGGLHFLDPTYPAQLLKVDPVTGNRVAVPNLSIGLPGMAREYGGQLVVSVGGLALLNPSTGASTTITGGNVGSGAAFSSFGTFALSGDNAFATDFSNGIFRIDLNTGARTIVAGIHVGTGPVDSPIDVAFDSAGNLIATTASVGVVRVDPTTGNRVVISSDAVGSGPATSTKSLEGLAIGADGSIFTAFFDRSGASGILKIDPLTGDRQLLANMSGEASRLYGVAIVPSPVPEPSTVLLAAIGGSLVLLRQIKQLRILHGGSFIAVAATALALASPQGSEAVTLRPGDLIVGARALDQTGAIYRIDPITGAPTILSDSTHGSGPIMHDMASVSIAPDGQLLVLDPGIQPDGKLGFSRLPPYYPPQLLRIDPATGNRTPVPTASDALGFPFYAKPAGSRAIVSEFERLVSIDLNSGAATLLSGAGAGSGPAITCPFGFSVDKNNAFVAEALKGVFRVDLATGNRMLLSGVSGAINQSDSPTDIAIDSHGDLIFTTYGLGVFRGDPVTGLHSVLSSDAVGAGPSFAGYHPFTLALAPDDSIYVPLNRTVNALNGAPWRGVLKIDSITGNRQELADLTAVTSGLYGVAVVPTNVPEPATFALAIAGAAAMVAPRRKHSRSVHGRA